MKKNTDRNTMGTVLRDKQEIETNFFAVFFSVRFECGVCHCFTFITVFCSLVVVIRFVSYRSIAVYETLVQIDLSNDLYWPITISMLNLLCSPLYLPLSPFWALLEFVHSIEWHTCKIINVVFNNVLFFACRYHEFHISASSFIRHCSLAI